MNVKLLRCTADGQEIVALAGKLCYSGVSIEQLEEKLTESEVDRFVAMLADLGHESPTEHVTFTFGVEGISRVLSHQLVRHRIGCSYSQQSQRYVKLDQFEYVVPKMIEDNPRAKARFIKEMENDQNAYNELVEILMEKPLHEFILVNGLGDTGELHPREYLERLCDDYLTPDNIKKRIKKMIGTYEKKAIENARYLFPNACETKIVFTMTARALFNFFHERCCLRAQDEIREMAYHMLKICKATAPELFKTAGAKCVALGYCPENAMQHESCEKITHKQLMELAKTK